MGVVLDTSVFISAERRGWSAVKLVASLLSHFPDMKFQIPSTVAAELIQGIFQASTPLLAKDRSTFVIAILNAFPVAPMLESTAWIAGRIRGEQAKIGNSLPFADSLIAACALELDDAVLTANVKDFIRIPGLRVTPWMIPPQRPQL